MTLPLTKLYFKTFGICRIFKLQVLVQHSKTQFWIVLILIWRKYRKTTWPITILGRPFKMLLLSHWSWQKVNSFYNSMWGKDILTNLEQKISILWKNASIPIRQSFSVLKKFDSARARAQQEKLRSRSRSRSKLQDLALALKTFERRSILRSF